MSAVLGFMVMTAVVTAQKGRAMAPIDPEQKARVDYGSWDEQEKIKELSAAVAKLEKDKTALQTALSSKNESSKVLNEQLQDLKMFGVLTDLEGPGLVVTLKDGPKPASPITPQQFLIDQDLLRVLNELWIAGAEAISVNGVRVTARSNFRCGGPDVVVDGQAFRKPIIIEAIGKPDVLKGALALPGGPVENLQKMDSSMATIQTAKLLRLAAYNGSTEFKLGKLPRVKR